MRSRFFSFLAFSLCLAGIAAQQTNPAPDALKVYQRGRDLEAAGNMAEANVQYQESIRICDAELAVTPGRIESFVVKSWCLLRLKRYAEAISTGQAASKYATDFRIVEVMAEAYFYQKDMENSLKYFQKYVEGVPETADRVATAYYFMGESYAGLFKLDHADIAFATALYMSPRSFRWWTRYGNLRERRGEKELALAAYEKALELSPGYPDALQARDRLRAQATQ